MFRTETIPEGDEEVIFYPVAQEPQPPPHTVLVYYPAYTSRKEGISHGSRGSRRDWHDFQHFKSVAGKPTKTSGVDAVADDYGIYPFTHSSLHIDNVAGGYINVTSQGSFVLPFGDPGLLDADLPPLYSDSGEDLVPAPSNLDELTKRALASMLPIIKAELSLPNFIYELKDFKRPLLQAANILKSPSFYSALKKVGKLLPFGKQFSFKKLLEGTAAGYLNYSFNLKPFVSDVAKLYSAISRTERRINDFVSRAGKPQSKHFNFAWGEFADQTDEYTNPLSPGWRSGLDRTITYNIRRHVSYQPTVFHAQIQYNYNYTGYQTEHARLLGHLDALGVNLNPAIIWNALPWTFVVDWVLGIGPFLDSTKVGNMEPLINIRRYLWSVARSRRISVSKGTKVAQGGPVITSNYMPSVSQTAYRRSVGIPSMSSIVLSGLSSSEVSLGAALVIVQGRRRRHKG